MTDILRVTDLNPKRPVRFELVPDRATLAKIAQTLDLLDLRKMRFEGSLTARGKSDWQLSARLGATVIQPCVVTVAPVTTRIEEDITRMYLADWNEPEETEVEMPEDDSTEQLPAELNLRDIATEALALALPPYPRADDAALGEAVYTEPGVEPMSEEAAKPFASLADLKKKLEGGG